MSGASLVVLRKNAPPSRSRRCPLPPTTEVVGFGRPVPSGRRVPPSWFGSHLDGLLHLRAVRRVAASSDPGVRRVSDQETRGVQATGRRAPAVSWGPPLRREALQSVPLSRSRNRRHRRPVPPRRSLAPANATSRPCSAGESVAGSVPWPAPSARGSPGLSLDETSARGLPRPEPGPAGQHPPKWDRPSACRTPTRDRPEGSTRGPVATTVVCAVSRTRGPEDVLADVAAPGAACPSPTTAAVGPDTVSPYGPEPAMARR